jgi:hypothetical protein
MSALQKSINASQTSVSASQKEMNAQEKNNLEVFDCLTVQAKNSVFTGTSIAY